MRRSQSHQSHLPSPLHLALERAGAGFGLLRPLTTLFHTAPFVATRLTGPQRAKKGVSQDRATWIVDRGDAVSCSAAGAGLGDSEGKDGKTRADEPTSISHAAYI